MVSFFAIGLGVALGAGFGTGFTRATVVGFGLQWFWIQRAAASADFGIEASCRALGHWTAATLAFDLAGALGFGAATIVAVFLVDLAFGLKTVVLVSLEEVAGELLVSPTQIVIEDSEVLEPWLRPDAVVELLEQAAAI